MSQLLRINGIAVPVLHGTADHSPKIGADDERAEDGTRLIARRYTKETFRASIAHRTPTEGVAWRRYILGEGHYWSFDDTGGGGGTAGLFSSKALGPTTSPLTGITLGTATPAPYLGAGRLKITATNRCDWVTGPALQGMTVMVAVNPNNTGWTHYVKTSAGTVWTNGVLTGALADLTLTPSSGQVRLAPATLDTCYDEMVMLPFIVPSDWPAQMYAWNNGGKQHSSLSVLTVDGDLVDANLVTKSVAGMVKKLSLMQGYLGGVYYQSIRTVDVELEEV